MAIITKTIEVEVDEDNLIEEKEMLEQEIDSIKIRILKIDKELELFK